MPTISTLDINGHYNDIDDKVCKNEDAGLAEGLTTLKSNSSGFVNNENDYGNLLLSSRALIQFICGNFVCQYCLVVHTPGSFSVSRTGFANWLHYGCKNCCRFDDVDPEVVSSLEGGSPIAEKPCHYSISDYSINMKAVIATQQLGISRNGVEVFGGFLGLSTMNAKWYTKAEQQNGLKEIELGEEIIRRNLQLTC